MGKWNGRISKQLAMSFNHFWSNIPILVNLYFYEMKSRWNEMGCNNNKWSFTYSNSADCANCLHIQSQLNVYVFRVSWLFTFSKSADCLHFQSHLIVYIFKVNWLFTFQSQLIVYIFKVSWLVTFSKSALIDNIFKVSWWHGVTILNELISRRDIFLKI